MAYDAVHIKDHRVFHSSKVGRESENSEVWEFEIDEIWVGRILFSSLLPYLSYT